MDAIRFQDVRFGWRRNRPVLDVPSFSVAAREKVFLKGASGSGKSTLLGLVGGVLEPWSGKVEILGTDLAGLGRGGRDAFRGDHIGFVFQMFNLIPYLSVLENVVLTGAFSAGRRKAAADEGEAQAARRLLAALGMDDPALLRRPAGELSQGQQQRVAAARALYGRPSLLIADEPTSALDADARGHFLSLLMRECEAADAALLFVSHDPALASRFDRTVTMEEINRLHPGRLAA